MILSAVADARAATTSRRKAFVISLVIVIGFFASVAFHYVLGAYRDLSYPYNTFLYRPEHAGSDFFDILANLRNGTLYSTQYGVYLPMAYLPVRLLTSLSDGIAFALFIGIFTLVVCRFVYRNLPTGTFQSVERTLITVIFTVMNYGFIFAVDRGNLECMVAMLLMIFVEAVLSDRSTVAALALGTAGAMKAYPLVFVAILVARRRYRAAVLSVGWALGATVVASYAYFGGLPHVIRSIRAAMAIYRRDRIVGDGGLAFNSSAFALIKVVSRVMHLSPRLLVGRGMAIYSVMAVCVYMVIAYAVIFRVTSLWKQVALLTCAMIVLPWVAYDYKLIFLLMPIVVFVREGSPEPQDLAYALAFGVLLIPKAYGWLFGDVNMGVIISPLLLLGLIASLLSRGWRATSLSGRPAVGKERGRR